MKKLIAALVALAVMALAPATALGAQGGTDRPYKVGVSTSTVVTNTSPTEGIVEFAGTVRGTHIGNGTIEGTGTLVATGETTFGYNAAYTITGTITGGTGRFEGASGSYTGAISNVVTAGAPPVTTYDSTASSLGTISY
jgi:hypothetical protein